MKSSKFFSRLTILLLALLTYSSWVTGKDVGVQLSPPVTPMPVTTPLYPNRDLDLDLLSVFEELMQPNNDCVLPCWWGFRPGVTTVDEIVTFLQETGFDRDWKESGLTITLEAYMREGEPFGLDFWDTPVRPIYGFGILFHSPLPDDELRRMEVEFGLPNRWLSPELDRVSFPYVLSQLSVLPEIYIPGTSSDANYRMHVVYKNIGVWLTYRFDLLENLSLEEPRVCFSLEQTQSVTLLLGKPDDAMIARFYEAIQNSTLTYYSIEDLYGMDIETLRKFFVSNPEGCLDDLVSG